MFDLYRGAILSIESRNGNKQVFLHLDRHRLPLVNWADLATEMVKYSLPCDLDLSSSVQKQGKGIVQN